MSLNIVNQDCVADTTTPDEVWLGAPEDAAETL